MLGIAFHCYKEIPRQNKEAFQVPEAFYRVVVLLFLFLVSFGIYRLNFFSMQNTCFYGI